jgi:hypothetical protein
MLASIKGSHPGNISANAQTSDQDMLIHATGGGGILEWR